VLRALDVVRAAPNEAKRRPADELASAQCSSPVVCSARDSCAEAYQHLARGTEAALRVKKELDKVENELPVSPAKMAELSNELDRADTEISGARDSLRRCEEAASRMRRTFGI
jgi:Skp family chaperone for outer membrane proteins